MMKLFQISILSTLMILLLCCFGSVEGMAQSAEKQSTVKTFKEKSMDAHTYFITRHNHLTTQTSYHFSNLYNTNSESLNKWVEIRSFLLTEGENEMAEDVAEMIDIMTTKLAEN